MVQAGPVAGIRVLDLGGEFSLYCSKLLADLGADVLRIEPPAGDSSRRAAPFVADESGDERSL
jgi:crotonobetainyl-CoA:carnitine CoA-transferase CaiB-like acyl-CoA transferase